MEMALLFHDTISYGVEDKLWSASGIRLEQYIHKTFYLSGRWIRTWNWKVLISLPQANRYFQKNIFYRHFHGTQNSYALGPCLVRLYTYSVKQPSQIMFWALLLRAQFICHTTESGNMKYQCHEIQSCEVEKNKIHTRYNLIRCVSSHRFDTNLDVNVWGSAWDLGVWDYITFSGKWGSGGRGAHRLCCKYVHQISWLVIHWK